MGKSFNETDDAVLEQASEKLNQLKPNIRAFSYNNPQDDMISGEASVGYYFTPQVYLTLQSRPDLKVVYPEEGMGFGIDSIFVPINAPHPDNAYAFINYVLDGQVGAQISEEILYLCPNTAAQEYLSDEFKNSQIINIPDEILGQTEFIEDVGDKTETYTRIWTEFIQQ